MQGLITRHMRYYTMMMHAPSDVIHVLLLGLSQDIIKPVPVPAYRIVEVTTLHHRISLIWDV